MFEAGLRHGMEGEGKSRIRPVLMDNFTGSENFRLDEMIDNLRSLLLL